MGGQGGGRAQRERAPGRERHASRRGGGTLAGAATAVGYRDCQAPLACMPLYAWLPVRAGRLPTVLSGSAQYSSTRAASGFMSAGATYA